MLVAANPVEIARLGMHHRGDVIVIEQARALGVEAGLLTGQFSGTPS